MALREPFNSISHMAGGALASAGLPLLILAAIRHGPLAIVAACVYGVTLVGVFTMSALYHAIAAPHTDAWLFRLDQSCIYLLIAGTYTPVALVLLGGATGWVLFGIEWGLAALGITLVLTVHRTPQWIHQAAYLVLGWAIVLALPVLFALPWQGIVLLITGGIAYTFGSGLYNRNRKGTLGLGDHELWHLLVIAGAGVHGLLIGVYVLGR